MSDTGHSIKTSSVPEIRTDDAGYEGHNRKLSTTSEEMKANYGNPGRRRSTFKGVATGMLAMKRLYTNRRSSVLASDLQKAKLRLENTYKTKPDNGKEYKGKVVEDYIYGLLEEVLEGEKYKAETCSRLACDLSIMIKSKVKELNIPRFKIICQVIIGQLGEQGMQTASRCLWDISTDRFNTVSYKNKSLWAVAMVHAVYQE